RAREARVPADRGIHGGALGDDDMTPAPDRTRRILLAILSLFVLALIYQAIASAGFFASALTPSLWQIIVTAYDSLVDGSMELHALYTLGRVLIGGALAVAVGLPLGIAMARFRPVEHFVMPLVSALMPIPSLAWVPVFILWFGLGNAVTIAIV